ncbi:hypothetical protein NDU88_001213 [Pleurodeles waltl]|uniref:Uncharacterized protein n=1 Tax=Pleurodeles waltl TaxID=8319 RepID=A0AAV7U7S8_PLEWA|nr:hypothetical protein NDU88_001213 [Pleurodeles waltl]
MDSERRRVKNSLCKCVHMVRPAPISRDGEHTRGAEGGEGVKYRVQERKSVNYEQTIRGSLEPCGVKVIACQGSRSVWIRETDLHKGQKWGTYASDVLQQLKGKSVFFTL